MKHRNDPGTAELPLPAKRGRSTIYSSALTPAERAKRYRRNVAERVSTVITNPQDHSVSSLCQALAKLENNPHVDPKVLAWAGHFIVTELGKRFPMPKRNK